MCSGWFLLLFQVGGGRFQAPLQGRSCLVEMDKGWVDGAEAWLCPSAGVCESCFPGSYKGHHMIVLGAGPEVHVPICYLSKWGLGWEAPEINSARGLFLSCEAACMTTDEWAVFSFLFYLLLRCVPVCS